MMTKTKIELWRYLPAPLTNDEPPPHINKMAILRKNNNDPPFLFKNYKKIDLVVKYRKNNGKQSRGHIIFLI